MGKQTRAGLWDRLAGKKVHFDGKFQWGEAERLRALAAAHGGSVAKDLGPKVDYLVVADASGSKTTQKKAMSLNAKGASIQVIDADAFAKLVEASEDEVLDLLRRGGAKAADQFAYAINTGVPRTAGKQPKRIVAGESFAGSDLGTFDFTEVAFEGCDFSRADLKHTSFSVATRCTFDKIKGTGARFSDPGGSTFKDADLPEAEFIESTPDMDFTGANCTKASFQRYGWLRKKGRASGWVFANATLKDARFGELVLVQPSFQGADLTDARFHATTIEAGNFRNAKMRGATLAATKLTDTDFSGADLSGASFVEADLSNSKFDGANLAGTNLRGAKTTGVDFSKAIGYDPNAQVDAQAGPALKELDKAIGKAKRIKFSFKLEKPPAGGSPGHCDVAADSASLQWGGGVNLPIAQPGQYNMKKSSMSSQLLSAARLLGETKIRFETLEVETTKSPMKANELRGVVTRALCEAFQQEPPDEEKLAEQIKAHREQARKATEGERKKREEYKRREEELKKRELAKVEQKVAKAVGGKVADVPSFLKALEVRADKGKIDKATKMLKAERFQLFNDITEAHLAGVVKSQTDPDLVYACRIQSNGEYACCTQNLNICGGLRGSICKHLLVLIIGLVKAGQLDPTTIDTWVSQTHQHKPELDKETMGEIFIRYKGAEAGEVDWRPTETVPEDYYAL